MSLRIRTPKRRADIAADTSKATAPDDEQADNYVTIGELAADLGVTTRAIRFYEHKGLITPPRQGKARAYSRRERARLHYILRGKNLGFSLEEIREWLELYDADPHHITQAKALMDKCDVAIADLLQKRADLDRSLRELREIRQLAHTHLATHGV